MNRFQQHQRHEEIRRDYEILVKAGKAKTAIATLAALYDLTPRQLRNIIKKYEGRMGLREA